jgi:hypothetical protein
VPSSQPTDSSSPSDSPSSIPSISPSLSSAPSEDSYTIPFRTTITGFFDAIAEGCSSDSVSFGGGYNSTAGELAMNLVLEVGGSTNLNQALKKLASLLDLPLDASFFDELLILDEIDLGGSLLIDLTFGATIDEGVVNTTSYGNVGLFVRINRFLVSSIAAHMKFLNTVSLRSKLNSRSDALLHLSIGECLPTYF